jgi:flagellin
MEVIGMVVQHNLTAMNSNRMLGITQGAQAKSSEKLSSGYRINRAGDDAAGLSISEKMRKQINGLDRASTNAQDGISAVQTAEGALTEVHSMLQRMNELAVQSANGTNSADDRAALQAEIDQLTTEITRVAETTKFNETYLLKGNTGDVKDVSFYESGYAITDGTDLYDAAGTQLTEETLAEAIKNGEKVYTDNTATTLAANGTDYGYVTKMYKVDGTALTAEEAKATTDDVYADKEGKVKITTKADYIKDAKVNGNLEFTLHVGADSEATNKIGISIAAMDSKALGVEGLSVSTEADATNAIDTIAQAIQKVSAQRSDLGAVQNRLEHTIANLDNVVENTTSAESQIRDTDMAEEMVNYSKNNILAQAGQAMLAQANTSTQGVLSLLG